MIRRSIAAAAVLSIFAFACSNQAGPAPCSSDDNCPTGSYCGAGGKCAALPAAYTVTLAETSATVTVGTTFQFSVTSVGDVTWSVQETFGGTIDPDGTYHAPATPGTYHVVATSLADTTKSATATVTVVPAPSAAIDVPNILTRGKTGVSAQVPAAAGLTYSWQLTGGTLTSAADGNQITFTAGTGASMLVSVTVTNIASSAANNSVAITLVDPPVAPTISAAQTVTAGRAGLSASIVPVTGLSYSWSLSNGTITAGANTDAITYVSGTGSTLTLTCTATNAAGDTAVATFQQTLVPGPTPAQIAAPLQLTQGASGTAQVTNIDSSLSYQWTISGGAFTDATAGANGTTDVGTSVAFVVSASANIATLSCIATNAAGDAANAGTANINLVAPSTAAITAPANVTAGKAGYTASVVAQAGASYAWSITGGSITSATNLSAITFTAGSANQLTLSCTVTNAAGTTASASLDVAVAPVPVAPVISAASKVTQGNSNATASVTNASASFTYNWSITGGTFNGAAPSTTASGDQVAYTAGTGATAQLICAAVNAAGDSVASSFTVMLFAPPVAPTFSGATTVTAGSINLVASVANPQPGESYVWTMIGNGTINGSTIAENGSTSETSNSIAYTAGNPGQITITIQGINPAGDSASSTTMVTAVAAPNGTIEITGSLGSQTLKTAATTGGIYVGVITLASGQGATTYSWTVSDNGYIINIINNIGPSYTSTTSTAFIKAGDITVGQLSDGGAAAPMQVACTITNAAGDSETLYADLPVYPVANSTFTLVGPSGPQDGGTYNGDYLVGAWALGNTASVPVQTGATYSWTLTGPFSTSDSLSQNSITFNALASPIDTGSIGLTVTNGAGDESSTGANITLVPAPYPTPLEDTPYYLTSADGGVLVAPSIAFGGLALSSPLEGVFLADAGSAEFPGGAPSAQGQGVFLNTIGDSVGTAFLEDPLICSPQGSCPWETQAVPYSITPVQLDAGLVLVAGSPASGFGVPPGVAVDGTGQSARLYTYGLSAARDGGAIFTIDSSSTTNTLRQISSDGGTTGQWGISTTPLSSGQNAIAIIDNSHFFGCTIGCQLFSTSNGWTSFSSTSLVNNLVGSVTSMSASDINTVYILSENTTENLSQLVRVTNNGSSWIESTVPGYWLEVHAADANNAWAAAASGYGDRIYQLQYDAGSQSWTETLIAGTGNTVIGYDYDIDGPGTQANFGNVVGIDQLDSNHLIVNEAVALRLVTLGDGGTNSQATVSTLRLAGQVPYGQQTMTVNGSPQVASAPFLAVVDGGVLWGDSNSLYLVTNPETPAPTATPVLGMETNSGNLGGVGLGARLNAPWGILPIGSGNYFFTNNHSSPMLLQPNATTGVWSTTPVSGSMPGGLYVGGVITSTTALPLSDGGTAVAVADYNGNVVWSASIATSGCPSGSAPCWLNGSVLAGVSGNSAGSEGVGRNASFSSPNSIAAADANTMLVGDSQELHLMQNNLSGTAGWTVTTLTASTFSSSCTDGAASGVYDYAESISAAVSNGSDYFYYSSGHCGMLRLLSNSGATWTISTLMDTSGNSIFASDVIYAVNVQTLYLARSNSGFTPPSIEKCTEASLGGPWSCSTIWTSSGLSFTPGPLGTASMNTIGGLLPYGPNQLLLTDSGAGVVGLLQYQ